MSQIVILTDLEAQKEIREAGVLPSSCFRSFEEIMEDEGSDDSKVNLFQWPYSPRLKAATPGPAEEEPTESLNSLLGMPSEMPDQEVEEYLAALQNSTLVHVIFIGESSGGNGGGSESVDSVQKVRAWYQRFQREVKHRFQVQNAERFTSVLVIVTMEDVHVTEADVQGLNNLGEGEDSFSTCYFMGYRLELGEKEVFHAPNVWPILVSRLLIGLLLRNIGQLGRGVRIWRAFEFIPMPDRKGMEELLRRKLNEAYKAAIENGAQADEQAWGRIAMPRDRSVRSLDPLKAPSIPRPLGSWASFPTRAVIGEVEDPARWEKGLREKGREYALRAEEEIFGFRAVEPYKTSELFLRIHENPAWLYAADKRLLFESGEVKELNQKQQEAVDSWKEMIAAEANRRRELGELKECAVELEAAQRHDLPLLMGVLGFLSVALVCGVVFSRLAQALGAGLGLVLALGGSAVVGALISGLGLASAHLVAGKRGKSRFITLCESADGAMIRRDAIGRKTLSRAEEAWRVLRRKASAFRLKLLLDRALCMVHTEIQQQAARTEAFEDADEGTGRMNVHQADRKEKVQRRYRSRTVLQYDVALGPDDMDNVSVDQAVRRFFPPDANANSPESLFHLWAKLCKEQDPHFGGNFPARVFVPELRAFMSRFLEVIQLEIRRQIFSRDADRKKLEEWVASGACGVVNKESHYLYFSAIFRLAQTRNDTVTSLLFVNPECLEGVSVGVGSSHEAPLLAQLLPVAFLFDEVGVRLGVDAEGHLGLQEEK